MTGAAFLTLILKLADKSSSDTDYRALALEWFNLVVKDIQNRQDGFHWRWLEKTASAPMVATQYNYQLPSDIDTEKIVSVYDRTNDVTYKFVPYEVFVKRIADPAAHGGDPWIFTIWADELWLFPTPTGTTTMYMDYIQNITALTDAATSIEIPAKYDEVIISGVLKWVYRFDPELGSVEETKRDYELGVQRMRSENSVLPSDTGKSGSHRARYARRGDIDGRSSMLFPLEDTSV